MTSKAVISLCLSFLKEEVRIAMCTRRYGLVTATAAHHVAILGRNFGAGISAV